MIQTFLDVRKSRFTLSNFQNQSQKSQKICSIPELLWERDFWASYHILLEPEQKM